MKILELQRPSIAALLELVESQPGEYRHVFRGHSNANWDLIPSLYRIQNPNVGAETLEKSYDLYEQQCIEKFFSEGMPYLPSIQRGYSNDRILAQHFGVPTRLLDWSRDPIVATFFAIEDQASDTDAAVFMLLPDAEYKPEWVKSLSSHKAIALVPPAIDRRIPAQKSVFTYHPYGPSDEPFVPLDQREGIGNQITTENGIQCGFAKIIIPAKLRSLLLHTLLSIGIDRRNLFPGLEGVGADLASRSKSGHIW